MIKKRYGAIFILSIFVLLSLFLSLVKFSEVPKCLNADEAAFGYNAYSILKTGKDEYGNFLPMRLKSFGDFKLPLYSYLSIPGIAIFGLNEFSTRFLAIVVGAIFPVVVYFFAMELFQKKKIGFVAGFLTAVSPWLHIFSRQAHEATLAAFFLTLTFIFFLRFIKRNFIKDFILLSLFSFLSLLSYHIARIPILTLLFILVFYLFKSSKKLKKLTKGILLFILILPILFFIYGDFKYNPARLNNLIFYKTGGFNLKINELRGEHDIRLVHNKLTQSFLDLSKEYSKYFSPEFLVINSDSNVRFGMEGVSPITIVEYVFLIVGIYYLFKEREKYRYFLIFLLLISPLSASLSWQSYSLARSFYLLIPILIISAYGFVSIGQERKKNTKLFVASSFLIFLIYNLYSWDFYFFHYPKKPLVIRSWECGYKELVSEVSKNYDKFKKIVVTERYGQPYIFFLYYLKIDPKHYQTQANLTSPDKYGFGQVLGFDKFDFRFNYDGRRQNLYIGFPDEFENKNIDVRKIKKIKIGSEEIFYLYET